MPIDPRAPGFAIPAPTVVGDRTCIQCGYALRGLAADGECPECGTPIRLPSTIDAPLSEMPEDVVRSLRRGVVACAITVVAAVGAIVAGALMRSSAAALALQCAVAVAWTISVWMATPSFTLPAAALRGFGPRGRLRIACRWLQLGWIAFPAIGFVIALWPPPPAAAPPAAVQDAVSTGRLIASLVGLGGLVVFSLQMQRVAEWVRDEPAERALNFALWGVAACTLLGAIQLPIPLLGVLLAVLWLVSVLAFPYGLLLLARSISIAVFHVGERHEREARRAARAEEAREAHARRLARADAIGDAGRRRDGG